MMNRDQIDTIEAAGWLVLDIAEHLREVDTGHVNLRSRAVAKRRIQRELGSQEAAGDPLNLSPAIRQMVLPGTKTKRRTA